MRRLRRDYNKKWFRYRNFQRIKINNDECVNNFDK